MAPTSKKRKGDQLEELIFNSVARQDYLTGFHKRKQARITHGREATMKREKEERVRERKQRREQRKQDLDKHIAEVNAVLRKQNMDVESDTASGGEEQLAGKEFTGFEEPEVVEGQEDEYVDEDKYTIVTVQAMEPSDDEVEAAEAEIAVAARARKTIGNDAATQKKRASGPANGKPKAKKKQFRYESKAERKETKQKQKAKNAKQAQARKSRS